jgi:GTP cyclohydrolase II
LTSGIAALGMSSTVDADKVVIYVRLEPMVTLTKGTTLSQPALPTARDTVQHAASCTLPTLWGTFQLHVFTDAATAKEHLALTRGDLRGDGSALLRIHSECLTGDTLFSWRCDCGLQLREALQRIASEGRGMLLYLRQEGRGIGLDNKIRAYALQDAGLDTVSANEALGFAADERSYAMCRPMLRYLGVSNVRLMTNNPWKVAALRNFGVTVTRVPIASVRTSHNAKYLDAKRTKLGHLATSAHGLSGAF